MSNSKSNILIKKASGNLVPFSVDKLRSSLLRTGADQESIENILNEVKSKLQPGMSTKKIYKMAFDSLKRSSKHTAARYRLKKAIMQLGPSGYPFEQFIGELLNRQKYSTKVSVIMEGKCVTHEVDVLAEKDNIINIIECKYHNAQGIFCDVKVPLYIHSRFNDIKEKLIQNPENKNRSYQGWVITNTKFSYDALQYGTCSGLKLLSWDYPENHSIKAQVDALGLYPVTCLTSITIAEKQKLLENKVLLCRDLSSNKKILSDIKIPSGRIGGIIEECENLCSSEN